MGKGIRSISRKTLLFLNFLAIIALLLSYLSTHISPAKMPFLALFGIAYGIILVLNLVFIVFWLIFKKRFALLSGITVLIGIGHFNAYFQLIPSSGDEGERPIQFVSQNVRLFGWYNWRDNIANRDEMIENLKKVEGDIYCFQEFFHNSGPGIFETRELLKFSLGTPFLHDEFTSRVGNDQHYGMATFSKYPIVGKGNIRFEGEKNNNMCIFTDIAIAQDTIRIYNTHLASIHFTDQHYRFLEDLKEDSPETPELKEGIGILERLTAAYERRAIQAEKIKAHMEESPYPVILCGDFNDTPVSYTYGTLSEGLEDSFRISGWGIGNTYIGTFPSFRIDYILHDEKLGSANYKTISESISDHHAITCEIFLPENSE